MTPSAADYWHGLRRLWWIPLITVVLGVGLANLAVKSVPPTSVTTGNALFTFRADSTGEDSAGAAREAEATVSQSRLNAYVQLSRSSERIREILKAAGIDEPPTMSGPNGGFKDPGSQVLIDVVHSSPGLVTIQVKNGALSPAESSILVAGLSTTVAEEVAIVDAQQEIPSLRTDTVITDPQSTQEPASRMLLAPLVALLLVAAGLGIVFLLVWRQGRLNNRRDIEERLGARVLGDLSGRSADAPAIALALVKGGDGGVRALLIPVGQNRSDAVSGVGERIACAARELNLPVRLIPVGAEVVLPHASVIQPGTAPGVPAERFPATTLTLFDACGDGRNTDSLRAATNADILALVVEYGRTSFGDLIKAGQTLAAITDAEIVVIGVYPSAKGQYPGRTAGKGQAASTQDRQLNPRESVGR